MRIMNIIMSLGSVFMLPILSEPISWLTTAACLQKTDSVKWFLMLVNFGLGIFICAISGEISNGMTFSDQICMVVSLSLAFIIGTFGWNMLRVVLNWVLAPFRTKNWAIRGLTAQQAEQIYLDMEAVRMTQEKRVQVYADDSLITNATIDAVA